jgi:predicted methyltransferase
VSEALNRDFSADEISVFDQVVKTRRSVRGFLDKRVPEDVLQAILKPRDGHRLVQTSNPGIPALRLVSCEMN